MKIFFIALLSVGPAIAVDFDFIQESVSTVSYTGHHMLHDFTGVTSEFNLTLNCSENQCSADIAIPLESFDSGNPSRDSNMLYYTKAWDYPDVRLISSPFRLPESNTDMKIHGKLEFHGFKNDVELDIYFEKINDQWAVSGGFKVPLSAYEVDRPSLLMIKIEDDVDIEFNLNGILKEKI